MRRIFIISLLAALLSSCADVSRLEKGALSAFGQPLEGAQEPLYYLIRIDASRGIAPRTMSAFIKLSADAAPLPLSELSAEVVAQYLPAFIPPPQWPEHWKKKALEEEGYAAGGFNIKFKNGKLLFIGICSHCAGGREYPTVGTPDGEKFYTLPLTRQQMVAVFGSPSRIYKVNEVRY